MTTHRQTKLILPTKQLSKQINNNQKPDLKYLYNRDKAQEPKRNKSAFVIFSTHTRAKLKEQQSPPNPNEMMSRLAEIWKNLSKEEKKPYEEEAHLDKVRYYQELERFWKENPSKNLQNKTKDNHIKKPCSAYALFLKDIKDDVRAQNPDLKMADILKLISQRWKFLDQKTRALYEKKAKKGKEEAKKKLNEYYLKHEGEEEYNQKKKAIRLRVGRRKVNPLETSRGNRKITKISSQIESNTPLSQTISNNNITVESLSCLDFMTFECSPIVTISTIETESMQTPKEDFYFLHNFQDLPIQLEKDSISDMISFYYNTKITIDDEVNLSRSSSMRLEQSRSFSLEIPALQSISPRQVFAKAIQNILDYEGQISDFTAPSSWHQFCNS